VINLPTKIGALIPNAISVSDFVNTKINARAIGTIASNQIQGLVAQAAASVNQAATAITNVKGIGKFGLDASQLQLSGLIKPGIADQIKQFPDKFKEILSSPTSWTGKLGAVNLDSVLSNTGLQTRIQQGLMNVNFDQLKQLGTIKGTEVAAQLGPLLNNATKFGSDTATAWLKGKAPGDLVNQLNAFATSAQFGQAFADVNAAIAGGGSPLQAGVVVAKGFSNTTNRTNVDQAIKAIIGDAKVATPSFAPPAAAVATTTATSSTVDANAAGAVISADTSERQKLVDDITFWQTAVTRSTEEYANAKGSRPSIEAFAKRALASNEEKLAAAIEALRNYDLQYNRG
jgi:hypothetical protein